MPIHDWSRVDEQIFRAFRLGWVTELCHFLNGGFLPSDFFTLTELLRVNSVRKRDSIVIRRDPDDRIAAVLDIAAPIETAGHPAVVVYAERVSHQVNLASIGGELPDLPVYLVDQRSIVVPLEATYMKSFHAFPRRWRDVLEPAQA
jgi:hypothetical protein